MAKVVSVNHSNKTISVDFSKPLTDEDKAYISMLVAGGYKLNKKAKRVNKQKSSYSITKDDLLLILNDEDEKAFLDIIAAGKEGGGFFKAKKWVFENVIEEDEAIEEIKKAKSIKAEDLLLILDDEQANIFNNIKSNAGEVKAKNYVFQNVMGIDECVEAIENR